MLNREIYHLLDHYIDQEFDNQVAFLQKLVRCPTDTPPGNNAPHADLSAKLLEDLGFSVEKYPVPTALVKDYGLESITNLVVRRKYNPGPTIALNAHGDVVPPGEGWTHPPYGGDIVDGFMYGRATAVSKSDFATYTFALKALEKLSLSLKGSVELHFTYDEEFGGNLGPGWLLEQGITKPDYLIAAGFSYQVVTAHNGCLQLEVQVEGEMAHAAIPDGSIDALQGAVHILQCLYQLNAKYCHINSEVTGITHPYLNIGQISAGTNTNVIPGKAIFKLDRRIIPEENPEEVEQELREVIAMAAKSYAPARGSNLIKVAIKRLLLAHPMKPLPGNVTLVKAIKQHAEEVFHEVIPVLGTPLYTDVRLYVQRGIPGVIYGAGPRTVRESHAKRADERLKLLDLKNATKVIARSLVDLLAE
ncbi:MAG: M20/M25/M40 family metallo-hydrolase [Gammaproteobacteria bacterium]|nr:M20/M25/M40 family metallo-hydrolase [Gammaproteobacteria bacterium]